MTALAGLPTHSVAARVVPTLLTIVLRLSNVGSVGQGHVKISASVEVSDIPSL